MNCKLFILPFSLLVLSSASFADSTTSKSTYDWTGVYVGGFIGGASSANTTTSGPIIDGETVFPDKSYSYDTSASFIGGGTVGYNWQIGKTPFLVGLEGEYGYLDMSGSKAGPNNPAPEYLSATHSTNVGGSYGYGLVGGRVGYALDKSLFYVKSGAVFTSTQTNFDFNIDNTPEPSINGINGHSSTKNNSVGFAIGGGIEQALPSEWFTLANHLSVKAEYLYLGINRTQISTGNINLPDGYPIVGLSTSDSISGIHTAKIGVNYKF
jgi:outer membrane immunogenic protein